MDDILTPTVIGIHDSGITALMPPIRALPSLSVSTLISLNLAYFFKLSFNTLPCAADNGTFVVVVVRLFTTSLFFKQFTKLLFNLYITFNI